jgi:hypothetical protein
LEEEHKYIEEIAGKWVANNFGSENDFQFCSKKYSVLECIRASIRTTLIVSGRPGYNLIHTLYKGLEPNTNIVNVIIYCKKRELKVRQKQFFEANYPVEIRFVV